MAEAVVALPQLLPIDDAAPLFPYAPASLRTPSFRDQIGCPYYRLGGRVFYDPADIAAWRAARRVGADRFPA